MSKPHHKSYPTTVFIVEGNPIAALVTGRRVEHRRFRSPGVVPRRHGASFVYTPSFSAPGLN